MLAKSLSLQESIPGGSDSSDSAPLNQTIRRSSLDQFNTHKSEGRCSLRVASDIVATDASTTVEKNRVGMAVLLVLAAAGLTVVLVVLTRVPLGDLFRLKIGWVLMVTLVLALIVAVVGGIAGVRAVFRREPGLVVDETGIRGYGFGHFPWEDITDVGITDSLLGGPVAIRLRPEAVAQLKGMLKQVVRDGWFALGTASLQIGKQDLDTLLRAYFSRFGTGLSNPGGE
jgi:hypothetical protein